MVVLIVNDTTKAQSVKVGGISGTSAQLYRTTSTEDMADKGKVGIAKGNLILSVPARSIHVIVAR